MQKRPKPRIAVFKLASCDSCQLSFLGEVLRIIDAWEPPPAPFVDVPPRAASGAGISEAP